MQPSERRHARRLSGRRAVYVVVPLVAILAIVLIFQLRAPTYAKPTGLGAGPTHNPKYASQSPAPDAARRAQTRWTNSQNEDDALETCTALGLNRLARRFGVPPKPAVVARAFARQWDPAFRSGAYTGCLASFHGQGG
jgi:hypothetical protein